MLALKLACITFIIIILFLKDHVSDTSEKILLKQYEKLILIKICYLYTINEITPTLPGKKKHNAPTTLHTQKHTHISLPFSVIFLIAFRIPILNDITPRCLYPTPRLSQYDHSQSPCPLPHYHWPASSFFTVPLLHRTAPCPWPRSWTVTFMGLCSCGFLCLEFPFLLFNR